MRTSALLLVHALLFSSSTLGAGPIEISARFNHGRVILPAKVNDAAEFHFLLDSACTIPTLHPDLVDELKLESSGSVRIAGISGEERAPTYRGVKFSFGSASYQPRRVASIMSERSHSRNRRDGVIGSSFFRQFVVEIIPARDLIRLHVPAEFQPKQNGKILPLTFRAEIPVVKAVLKIAETNQIEGDFELDTGCDSGLCIGEPFAARHKLADALGKRASEKFGVGGTVETVDGIVPEIKISDVLLKNVQADLFTEGSPVDEPFAGHIGMRAFDRKHLIIDYSRKQITVLD